MTRAVAIALVLTLSSSPITNIACVAWCDARWSENGDAADVCHSALAHSVFGVIASPDACEAFASTPFIREDNRRLVPAAVSVDIVLLPAVLGVPGHWVQHAVSAGTQRLPRHYAQILVLRI